MPPIVHLLLIIVIVLVVLGIAWRLINSIDMDARVKQVVNAVLVIGLLIWLLIWLLPRLLAAV